MEIQTIKYIQKIQKETLEEELKLMEIIKHKSCNNRVKLRENN